MSKDYKLQIINYFNTLLPNDNLNMFKDCSFQITNRFNTLSWNTDPHLLQNSIFCLFLVLISMIFTIMGVPSEVPKKPLSTLKLTKKTSKDLNLYETLNVQSTNCFTPLVHNISFNDPKKKVVRIKRGFEFGYS